MEKLSHQSKNFTHRTALKEHRCIIPKNDWKSSQDKASNGCWLSALQRDITQEIYHISVYLFI